MGYRPHERGYGNCVAIVLKWSAFAQICAKKNHGLDFWSRAKEFSGAHPRLRHDTREDSDAILRVRSRRIAAIETRDTPASLVRRLDSGVISFDLMKLIPQVGAKLPRA